MADKKYMVVLPAPSRLGRFHREGPMTEVEALRYLRQWYPSAQQEELFALFVKEPTLGDDATDEEVPRLPSPEPGDPRYPHSCDRCVFEGRFGRYDAYFCPAGGAQYATVVLRYGGEADKYKSRPRFIHEKDPEGFPEAAAYTAVFAKHPRTEGAR